MDDDHARAARRDPRRESPFRRSRLRLEVGWIRRTFAPGVSRIPGFRPPGKPQPPGQVLVAPLELRRGELVKVAGFALQAAAAETERVAAKVQEGQTSH